MRKPRDLETYAHVGFNDPGLPLSLTLKSSLFFTWDNAHSLHTSSTHCHTHCLTTRQNCSLLKQPWLTNGKPHCTKHWKSSVWNHLKNHWEGAVKNKHWTPIELKKMRSWTLGIYLFMEGFLPRQPNRVTSQLFTSSNLAKHAHYTNVKQEHKLKISPFGIALVKKANKVGRCRYHTRLKE